MKNNKPKLVIENEPVARNLEKAVHEDIIIKKGVDYWIKKRREP